MLVGDKWHFLQAVVLILSEMIEMPMSWLAEVAMGR
jgi:hypothetical protein